jgi:outer membrane receptor for ferrienterochelin and colicins
VEGKLVSILRSLSGSFALALALAASTCASSAEPGDPKPDALGVMSLEELMQMRIETVYGASKYEQKTTRAPSSVTVLTGEDIARFGHRTLAEALRSIRGLYVSNDRNYSYLGVRGFLRPGDYNSRVLVLIDGHRMNDNVYDAAYFAREGLLAVDVIDRVEFVRGPSSSIYGSSAFFGIVNIVTKHGDQVGGAQLAVSAESFDGYDGRFSYGRTLPNDVEATLTASFFSSGGHGRLYFPEFDPTVSSDVRAANAGIAAGRDDEEALGILASIKRDELTLSTSILSRLKEVPTASFGTAFNSAERTADYRGYLDLKYEHAFAADLQLLGRMSYDRYAYYGDYPYDYAAPGDPPAIAFSRDDTLGTWLATEWQVTRTLFNRHTLIAGVEYRKSLRQRQLAYDDTVPRFYGVDDDHSSRNAAVFAQGEFTLAKPLVLNAGVRYDYYFESFGGTVNPRLALIFSPGARTTLKLLYGQAFRAPSAYERFYYLAGPESLEPETIRTQELVLEQYLGTHDRLTFSAYHYEVDGLITQLANSASDLYFDNVTHVTADGAEVEWEGKYESGLLARLSYALQRTKDSDTHRALTSSPRHLAKINLGLPLGGWIDAGVELQYHGAVHTLAGAQADDFVLANLSIATRAREHGFQFSAGLYNLFDVRYGYPGAEDHVQDLIQQDGRTVRLKLMRTF